MSAAVGRFVTRALGHAVAVAAVCAAVPVSVVSCSTEENNVATRQGYIDVRVSMQPEFRMPDGTMLTPDAGLIPNPDSLALTLSNESASHTWPTVKAFRDDAQSFMAGAYTMKVAGGMPDGPRFEGVSDLELQAAGHTSVDITATPSVAMLHSIYTDNSTRYTLDSIMVFVPLQGFVTVASSDSLLYVSPGAITTYAHISDKGADKSVMIAMPGQAALNSAQVARMGLTLTDDDITAAIDGTDAGTVNLAGGLPDNSPVIIPSGFTPGTPISIIEGLTLSEPVTMTVSSPASPLRHVNLVVEGPILEQLNLETNSIDLINLSPEDAKFLEDSGIRFEVAKDRRSAKVDYTEALEDMASFVTTVSHFSIMAEDEAGTCNNPVELVVRTRVMSLTLTGQGTATVGVNRAMLSILAGSDVVEENDFSVYTKDSDGTYTVALPIASKSHDSGATINLWFNVPAGVRDIPVQVRYLGQPRLETVIKRVNPIFSLNADPFATTAVLSVGDIDSSLPQPDSVAAQIVRYASVTVDGRAASIWTRDPSHGVLIITGLTPGSRYKVALTLAGNTPAATAALTTEKAESVPMGDFSDWERSIKYENLPCGGKFSASSAPVVNRQNFVNVDVNWPKHKWASMNAKTFNRKAANHNTWYMQPSAILENISEDTYTKAIAISSTGYDANGKDIPDYIQEEGQRLPYSANVPEVKGRAAGRLWLGSYDFNPADGSEKINEGVPFACRPSALNGYFKYLPDLIDGSDYGYVRIELVNITDGKETKIATGMLNFRTQPDYAAFRCPINYLVYDLKPTHLRMMFVSSHHADCGDTANDRLVPVTPDLPNARMRGSTLWVSQLTFSY